MFFPGKSKNNKFADRIDAADGNGFYARGGPFITLESQSLLGYGWTDPLLDLLQANGYSLQSRISGIIDQSNTPYQAEDVWHDNSCYEDDTFKSILLEDGMRGGEYQVCKGNDDVQRGKDYVASNYQDKWKKPCHYKKNMYLKEVYTGQAEKPENMFKVHSDAGFTKALGSVDRRSPFNTWYKTDAKRWGEDVAVEGYASAKIPPLMMLNEKGKKINFEWQLEANGDVEKAEKLIEELKEKNPKMFANTITMWISGLFRPLAFDFEKTKALKGTNDGAIIVRKYAPKSWTRFTKNKIETGKTWAQLNYDERMKVSSDNYGGPEEKSIMFGKYEKKQRVKYLLRQRKFSWLQWNSNKRWNCSESNC